MNELQELKQQAVWIAHTLYQCGKVTGSTANLSFRHNGNIWVTKGGGCFGRLIEDDLVCLDHENTVKASKEWPLHKAMYDQYPEMNGAIHTHSTYVTAWSCLRDLDGENPIPTYTPYLKIKLGSISMVPYAPPGSQELFNLFIQSLTDAKGYLLRNHGSIVAGKTLLDAYYALEELEESARIAWMLKGMEAIKLT